MSENRIMFTGIVHEGTTRRITAQLTDEALSTLASNNLLSLVMTLYAPEASGDQIINANEARDILNVNQGTVTEEGLITITLSAADNQILDDTKEFELHRMLLTWTFDSEAPAPKTGHDEIDFYVRNLSHV